MKQREHSAHKRLYSEWTDRGLIFIAVLMVTLGLIGTLMLMMFPSRAAIIMWVVTWSSLTIFVLLLAKRTVTDPGYRINRRAIDKTRREIMAGRQAVRKELLENEIRALCRGERNPVLDVWRLDESLAKRHPFFRATTCLMIDPRSRELLIRVQVDEIQKWGGDAGIFSVTLFEKIAGYLSIISNDAYLALEAGFFDRLIMVIDSMREDERHVDVPYPVASLLVSAGSLWSVAAHSGCTSRNLGMIAQIRFNNCEEIEPHRAIEVPSSRGLK